MPRRVLAAFVVALFITTTPAGTRGQQLGRSRTILLTVTDDDDHPVIDLLPDDFIVREGGEPREILNARLADYPVVLMVDNGVGRPGDFDPLLQAAERFVDRVGPRPVVLGRLSNPPALVTSFGDDHVAVVEALHGLEVSPARSSPVQGIIQAAEMLTDVGLPFSGIVVLSAETTETTQMSMLRLARVLSASRARLYVVLHRRGMRDRTNLDFLANLSEQTGGQYIPIYSVSSFEPAVDRILDRLLTEMLVEYLEPPDAEPADDVRVGVRRPGARAKGLGITPP